MQNLLGIMPAAAPKPQQPNLPLSPLGKSFKVFPGTNETFSTTAAVAYK